MSTEFGACEFEDSQNCIWNAQEQGNGIGQSFVDIDGTTYYVENPVIQEDVWEDGWLSFPYQYVIGQENGEDIMIIIWEGDMTLDCPPDKVPGWLDETGQPTSCVDNNPTPLEPKDKMVVPEETHIDVPTELEAVEVVPVTPEAVETGVTELAETGTAEVITGALLGIALVVAGVFTMMKGRRVA